MFIFIKTLRCDSKSPTILVGSILEIVGDVDTYVVKSLSFVIHT